MQDLAKVKRNLSSMIDQGAPQADTDAYIASEGVTLDMLKGGSAPKPVPVSPAPVKAPAGPRGSLATSAAMARFAKAKFPHINITSTDRTPEHNRKVNGVEGSYHVSKQAIDYTGLSQDERRQLDEAFKAEGVNFNESLFHNAGSGIHGHRAADNLPDSFMQKWGDQPSAAMAPDASTPLQMGAVAQPASDLPSQMDHRPDAAEMEATNIHLRNMFRDGESSGNMVAYARSRNVNLNPEELAKAIVAREGGAKEARIFTDPKDVKNLPAPAPAEGGLIDNHIGNQAVRGLGDMATFAGDAIVDTARDLPNWGGDLSNIYKGLTGDLTMEEQNALIAERDERHGILGKTAEAGYDSVLGKTEPTSNFERYGGAIARGATGAVVPFGAVTKGAQALTKLATSGAGAGAGMQAGTDIAPNSKLAPLVGGILGGVAGAKAPNLAKSPSTRFADKQLKKNPYAAYDAEIAPELKRIIDETAVASTDPKARADLAAIQINALERSYTTRFKTMIKSFKLDPRTENTLLTNLEEGRITPTVELQNLRQLGPEGVAVADGLIKAQRLRALTPEIKRGSLANKAKLLFDGAGAVAGAFAAGNPLGAAPGYALARFVTRRGTEAEAARVHSAERVVKRSKAYRKVAERTGPSGQIESKAAMNEKFVSQQEGAIAAADAVVAEKAATAKAKQQTAADKAAETAAKADLKASRGGMTDAEFFKRTVKAPQIVDPADVKVAQQRKNAAFAKSALAKLEAAAATGPTAKAIDKLNAPAKEVAPAAPKPVKRTALDQAHEAQMDLGFEGRHNSYADMLGVTRPDVLKALKQIDVSDVDAFQLRKFEQAYPIDKATQARLLPRLEKALSGVKAKAEAAAAASPAPAATPKAKAAKTAPTKAKSEAPVPAAQAPEGVEPAPLVRRIVRPKGYERGTGDNIRKANYEIDGIKNDPDIPNGIKDDVTSAAERVRDDFKTKEDAWNFIDDEVMPDFEMNRSDPKVIALIRRRLREVANRGKTHETAADYEAAVGARPRGRPPRPAPDLDDVPF